MAWIPLKNHDFQVELLQCFCVWEGKNTFNGKAFGRLVYCQEWLFSLGVLHGGNFLQQIILGKGE
jgi:hypothetical protein